MQACQISFIASLPHQRVYKILYDETKQFAYIDPCWVANMSCVIVFLSHLVFSLFICDEQVN